MSTPTAVPRVSFSVTGSLPTGTTVLEASAGTGKTYTIAALAARYIAEGRTDLSGLMMVTFGRMATNELRLRVRERLASTERSLAWTLSDRGSADAMPATTRDPLDELLADGDRSVVAARHRRVRAALADFDAATIATTHEFCQTMLTGLGVLGDQEPESVFTESISDLVHEVAADCYLRRFATLDTGAAFTFDEAMIIAEQTVQAGSARLVPVSESAEADRSAAGQRYRFAVDVRREVARRKRRAGVYSFDDMLTRLQSCLADPQSGSAAAGRLRRRFPVVLVDEFQDTDPVQWDILRRAFHGHSTLILIGDPKQAIYAFRGADVFSYLGAVSDADQVATLDTSWRSDAPLLSALDAVYGDAALGDPRIVVRPVRAAHPESRIRLSDRGANHPGDTGDDPSLLPIRVRTMDHDPSAERFPPVAQLRAQLAEDLAADVARLLRSGMEIQAGSPAMTGAGSDWRPVRPGDVAVLVRRNDRLDEIRTALAAAGVPAVVRGASSVFATELADQWRRLLRTLEQPRQALIRDCALTCFVGWDIAQLASADDEAIDHLAAMVRRWAKIINADGVAALVEAISDQTRLAERLLAEPGGERRLTDLRHLGQSLHAAMTAGGLGTGALSAWLLDRMREATSTRADELSRRLETDAEAVQVLTIHRSKGLEFPIVYLPEAWDRYVGGDDRGHLLRLHDDTRRLDHEAQLSSGTMLDVGGLLGPDRRDRLARSRQEEAGEDLRLYYVAMTRARSQLITWWMPSFNTASSALQRFLFRGRAAGGEPELRYEVTQSPAGLPQLDPTLFSIEPMPIPDADPATSIRRPPAAAPQPDEPVPLTVRRFDRDLDLEWRRTSYSALTAAAHGAVGPGTLPPAGDEVAQAPSPSTAPPGERRVGSEPEVAKEDDESGVAAALADLRPARIPQAAGPGSGAELASPMSDLPMGPDFGTVVHAVLENFVLDSPAGTDAAARESAARESAGGLAQADSGAADSDLADRLTATLSALASAELSRGPAGPLTGDLLGAALTPATLTPLGPLADDLRLADIAPADRLSELTFELPLAGGDRPSAEVRLGDLAPLLERHLPGDDPLIGYPNLLRVPLLAEQSLRGYLTGSIDAVLRVHDQQDCPDQRDTETRYLVVDYKTNWLGDPERLPLPVANYHPASMAQAMMQAHYPLQALLYSVALHRYLRWRQPGYHPDRQLGGILYLFLRGMAGPDTPRVAGVPYGVFSWRPPATLIVELSDLLDGRS